MAARAGNAARRTFRGTRWPAMRYDNNAWRSAAETTVSSRCSLSSLEACAWITIASPSYYLNNLVHELRVCSKRAHVFSFVALGNCAARFAVTKAAIKLAAISASSTTSYGDREREWLKETCAIAAVWLAGRDARYCGLTDGWEGFKDRRIRGWRSREIVGTQKDIRARWLPWLIVLIIKRIK